MAFDNPDGFVIRFIVGLVGGLAVIVVLGVVKFLEWML